MAHRVNKNGMRFNPTQLRKLLGAGLLSLSLVLFATIQPTNAATAQRVQVTGEIIDTWCYVTEIMFSEGTAHHQCAVWCALGGIPVSILGKDGKVYMVLRVEGDDNSVANPTIVEIQSHEVTVDGDLYERDGVNYLIVNKVADDKGVINMTHEDYGIQPFGE
ncbi:hypothetical protein [Pelagibius sp. Alg239-R121]|uniref:hypothetical protein n=1 Tax=Pelagibius sp. Alg239-R121 TaxID=2993448 RepID=UPI0024A66C78|nr:hypothetical protein [Pelagibius sp. Alg239-R121]